MADFKKMNQTILLSLRKECQAELSKLSSVKLDDDPHVKQSQIDRIAKLNSESEAIDVALGEKANEDLNNTIAGDSYGYELNRIVSSIRSALDKCGDFRASGLINQFCNRINPIYSMFVETKKVAHPTLELEFTNLIVTKLPFSSQAKFASERTWDSLQAKLKTHFQADISIFQHLSKVWACQSSLLGSNWMEQSTKLIQILAESKTNIKSFYQSKDKTLSADDVFALMGAMIMSESVKINKPDVYRMMLESLDSCSSADDVAKKASFYTDRLDTEMPSFFTKILPKSGAPTGQSSKAAPNQQSNRPKASKELVSACIKKKVCIDFNNGGCNKGSACKYKHELVSVPQQTMCAQIEQIADWSEDCFGDTTFQ